MALITFNPIAKKPLSSPLVAQGDGLKAISLFKEQGGGPGENGPQDPRLPQATSSARFNNIVLFQLCLFLWKCLSGTDNSVPFMAMTLS